MVSRDTLRNRLQDRSLTSLRRSDDQSSLALPKGSKEIDDTVRVVRTTQELTISLQDQLLRGMLSPKTRKVWTRAQILYRDTIDHRQERKRGALATTRGKTNLPRELITRPKTKTMDQTGIHIRVSIRGEITRRTTTDESCTIPEHLEYTEIISVPHNTSG